MGRPTLKEQRRRELQERREAGAWFPIPVVVIRSEAFCRLSSHAVKLLFDLLSQYSLDVDEAAWMEEQGHAQQGSP